MALIVSELTWRVVWSATYSTTAATDSAFNAVNSVVSGYSVSPRAGRYTAGLNKPSTTTVTASYETDNEDDAKALATAIQTAYTTNRTSLVVAIYRGNTP